MRYYDAKLYYGMDERSIQIVPVNGASPASISPTMAKFFPELYVNANGIYFRDKYLVRMSLLGTGEEAIDQRAWDWSYMDLWGGYRLAQGKAVDNSDNYLTALSTYGVRGATVVGAIDYVVADKDYAFLVTRSKPVGAPATAGLIRLPRSLDRTKQSVLFSGKEESVGWIVLDETRIYLEVAGAAGRIVSMGKDGTGLRVLATATSVAGLAVDSLDVYWVDGKNIMRAPKDGSGAPTKAFQACEGIDNITASDGQGVYFTSHSGKNHTIWKLTR